MAACTLQLPERIVLHAYGMAMRCLGSIPIELQILQAMAPVSEFFGGVNVTSRMSWAMGSYFSGSGVRGRQSHVLESSICFNVTGCSACVKLLDKA